MLLSVVSVGIVSSSAPLALEVEGLQEAVELDSEVELLEQSTPPLYNCSSRHVSSGYSGQCPLNYFEYDIMLRSLCIMCDYALMFVDAYYAQNCADIME